MPSNSTNFVQHDSAPLLLSEPLSVDEASVGRQWFIWCNDDESLPDSWDIGRTNQVLWNHFGLHVVFVVLFAKAIWAKMRSDMKIARSVFIGVWIIITATLLLAVNLGRQHTGHNTQGLMGLAAQRAWLVLSLQSWWWWWQWNGSLLLFPLVVALEGAAANANDSTSNITNPDSPAFMVRSRRQQEDDARIVGGYPVEDPNWHPYLGKGLPQRCSCTLIHYDFCLSAAHCNTDTAWALTNRVVYFGGVLADASDATVSLDIQTLYDTSLYDSDKKEADVMLIQFTEPTFAIPLATWNDNSNLPVDNQIVSAIGYGRLRFQGALPFQMQRVEVPVINTDICNASNFYNGNILDDMLCAGVTGLDACQGDSGGPLLVDNEVVGIVSWGFGCAVYPGVYARTSSYDSWILDTICNHTNVYADYCEGYDREYPFRAPTLMPTASPTTATPSSAPSKLPTVTPTTQMPTSTPSKLPSRIPSSSPSASPSNAPSTSPSTPPSSAPSSPPSVVLQRCDPCTEFFGFKSGTTHYLETPFFGLCLDGCLASDFVTDIYKLFVPWKCGSCNRRS